MGLCSHLTIFVAATTLLCPPAAPSSHVEPCQKNFDNQRCFMLQSKLRCALKKGLGKEVEGWRLGFPKQPCQTWQTLMKRLLPVVRKDSGKPTVVVFLATDAGERNGTDLAKAVERSAKKLMNATDVSADCSNYPNSIENFFRLVSERRQKVILLDNATRLHCHALTRILKAVDTSDHSMAETLLLIPLVVFEAAFKSVTSNNASFDRIGASYCDKRSLQLVKSLQKRLQIATVKVYPEEARVRDSSLNPSMCKRCACGKKAAVFVVPRPVVRKESSTVGNSESGLIKEKTSSAKSDEVVVPLRETFPEDKRELQLTSWLESAKRTFLETGSKSERERLSVEAFAERLPEKQTLRITCRGKRRVGTPRKALLNHRRVPRRKPIHGSISYSAGGESVKIK